MVPRTGLEPANPFGRQPLKLMRLPISPPGDGTAIETILIRAAAKPVNGSAPLAGISNSLTETRRAGVPLARRHGRC